MLQKPAGFTPHAAFFAVRNPDGSIVVREFNDPATVVVIVAEFEVQGDDYIAFYHEDIDQWEVNGEEYNHEQFYQLAIPGTPFYIFAEHTVDAFRDALLKGPGCGRVARKLAREMVAEIDGDIINDLRIASGSFSTPLPVVNLQTTPSVSHRIMKATWTMEAAQDLKAMNSIKYIGRSKLYSKDN